MKTLIFCCFIFLSCVDRKYKQYDFFYYSKRIFLLQDSLINLGVSNAYHNKVNGIIFTCKCSPAFIQKYETGSTLVAVIPKGTGKIETFR